MSSEVKLVKKVRGISTYKNVIDYNFSELVKPVQSTVDTTPTVEEFFSTYDKLFYDIPLTGDINSHEYLVRRSSEYLGGSVFDPEKEALIEEINSLRQQILDMGQTFLTIDNLK